MRQINYIFIDSDRQNDDGKSGCHALSNFGYHFVVNSERTITKYTDIKKSVHFIPGPIYDPDKYDRCSICIRYCGNIAHDMELSTFNSRTDSKLSTLNSKLSKLIELLLELRRQYPDAKILGLDEIRPETWNLKLGTRVSVCASNSMNLLRRELSNLL